MSTAPRPFTITEFATLEILDSRVKGVTMAAANVNGELRKLLGSMPHGLA